MKILVNYAVLHELRYSLTQALVRLSKAERLAKELSGSPTMSEDDAEIIAFANDPWDTVRLNWLERQVREVVSYTTNPIETWGVQFGVKFGVNRASDPQTLRQAIDAAMADDPNAMDSLSQESDG
jgi:hypothetical protein